MAQTYETDVTLVGVGSRDTEQAITEFVNTYGLGEGELINAVDLDGEIWTAYGVNAQPAWVFIDGETGEVERHFGALEEPELRAALEELAG